MNVEKFLIANLIDDDEIMKLLSLSQNKRNDGNYKLNFRKITSSILHIQLLDVNNKLVDIGLISKPDVDSIDEIEKSNYYVTYLIVEDYDDDLGNSYFLEYHYK